MTYLYRCSKCRAEQERQHRMTETPRVVCALCGGRCVKVVYPPAVIFRGRGFYSTDNKRGDGDKKPA